MKPGPGEYPPYYEKYISMVEEEDLTGALYVAGEKILSTLSDFSEEEGNFRYAENKWSVKELVQHIIDTERIMGYRALCFSRNETGVLPGFDENAYATASMANERTLMEIGEDFNIMRLSTISLFRSFNEKQLTRKGTSGKNMISVRALGFMIAGHGIHHLSVLREKYLGIIQK